VSHASLDERPVGRFQSAVTAQRRPLTASIGTSDTTCFTT